MVGEQSNSDMMTVPPGVETEDYCEHVHPVYGRETKPGRPPVTAISLETLRGNTAISTEQQQHPLPTNLSNCHDVRSHHEDYQGSALAQKGKE
jgi:hypothetical protein